MNFMRAAWRRLRSLFRRAPEPDISQPSILGMVTTTGADELARRERLRRISGIGSHRGWMERPERLAERYDRDGF